MTDQATSNLNADEPVRAHRSLWSDVWRQFKVHRGGLLGIAVFSFILLAVIFGPLPAYH